MKQTDKEIASLIKLYGRVGECTCGGIKIPGANSLQSGGITIYNFPCMNCVDCGEKTYGTGTLIRSVRTAKKMRDDTGRSAYNYTELEA